MVKTNKWHKGSKPLNPVWKTTSPLLADELFSSWLIRLALNSGLSPISLTQLLWPNKRVWTIDIDRESHKLSFENLSKLSGIAAENINKSFLDNILKSLNIKGNNNGTQKWLLSLGIRNRRRNQSLQYCPICFNSPEPFLKIEWRFVWQTCCSTHHCLLLDHCFHCGAMFLPHLLEPNGDLLKLHHCYRCKNPLVKTEASKPPTDSIKMQSICNKKLSNLKSSNANTKWFNQLNKLCVEVRKKYFNDNFEQSRYKLPVIRYESLPLEHSHLTFRVFIFSESYKNLEKCNFNISKTIKNLREIYFSSKEKIHPRNAVPSKKVLRQFHRLMRKANAKKNG